jgi:hypothetical protein
MKILKIALILLLPAIGIVGCKKSDMKPGGCNGKHETESNSAVSRESNAADQEPAVLDPNAGQSSNRTMNTLSNTGNSNSGSTEIYGSGDDDRDGGDKSKKKTLAK